MHEKINEFNKCNGVPTPLLFGTVHRVQNNKHCNYYNRLREGYKFSEALRDAWADRMIRFTAICKKLPNTKKLCDSDSQHIILVIQIELTRTVLKTNTTSRR